MKVGFFFPIRFVFFVFVGGIVVSCIPLPEVPIANSEEIEEVVLREEVGKVEQERYSVEEEQREQQQVCMDKEIVEEFYSLYHHHIHHHTEHQHPPHILKPIPEVLEELEEREGGSV